MEKRPGCDVGFDGKWYFASTVHDDVYYESWHRKPHKAVKALYKSMAQQGVKV